MKRCTKSFVLIAIILAVGLGYTLLKTQKLPHNLYIHYYVCVDTKQYEALNPSGEDDREAEMTEEDKASLAAMQDWLAEQNRINTSCVANYFRVGGSGIPVSDAGDSSASKAEMENEKNELIETVEEYKKLNSYMCVRSVDSDAWMKALSFESAPPTINAKENNKRLMKTVPGLVLIPGLSDDPAPMGNLVIPQVKSHSRCAGSFTELNKLRTDIIPQGYYYNLSLAPAPKGPPPPIPTDQ